MSELMASTSEADCLDLEDLAAFADGRLTGFERERAVKHLADCERCYEVFAEVVQFQEDEDGQDEEDEENRPGAGAERDQRLAEVVVHPRSRSWLWPSAGAAVAAAALVVLVAAPLLRDGRRPPPAAGWDEHGWLTLRGGPILPLSPEARAFRLGVRSIDLMVALEAGRADPAKAHSAWLVGVAGDLEHSNDARVLLQDLRARLRVGEAPASLVRQAEKAVGLLEDVASPPQYYELGKWVEEGRAAALVGDHRFFTSRLKGFEPSPESPGGLPRELIVELNKVRSLIAAKPTGEELKSLERALARIVDLAGGR